MAALTATGSAWAERVPLGGRTATMGGAAVAAGNDSAMPYLNPAGVAGVPQGVFGVSATLYTYRRLQMQDYFLPRGWSADDTESFGRIQVERDTLESSTYVEMPSSVMYFGPMGDLGSVGTYKLGIALATPEVEHRELVGSFLGTLPEVNGSLEQRIGLSYRRSDYYVGPSLAMGFWDDLRVGVSAFAYYSRYHRVENFSYELIAASGTRTSALASTAAASGESLGLVPVLGLQYRLTAKLWAGAAVSAASVHLWGQRSSTGSVETAVPTADGASMNERYDTTAAGEYQQSAPWRITAGLAWDDREAFSVAADATYRAKRRGALRYPVVSQETYRATGEVTRRYTRTQEPVSFDLEQSIDLSLGVEVALSPVFSLRAGGFTDFSNAEPLAEGRGDDRNRVRLDQLGGSLGLGMNYSAFDTTIGAVYTRGAGEIGALDGATVVPVDAVQHSFFLILSGTVSGEEAKKQIEDTVGIQSLPALPESETRGLKYEPPPYGPAGLGTDAKPRPMTEAEREGALDSPHESPPEPEPDSAQDETPGEGAPTGTAAPGAETRQPVTVPEATQPQEVNP